MSYGRLFAFLLIALSLLASVCYGIDGDARRCVYWFAAAVLNLAVTV